MSNPISAIQQRIREFRDERDWMQFHNPKDMAIAISVEANELLEHFLWKSPQEVDAAVKEKPDEIRHEVADIGILLLELADILRIDLEAAIKEKMAINAAKYPVDKAAGSNRKYTEL